MKSVVPILTVVCASIAALGSPGFAGENVNCAAVANRAALQAVNDRTSPLGQTFTIGQPFVFGRGLLRAEVEVFGGRDLLYGSTLKSTAPVMCFRRAFSSSRIRGETSDEIRPPHPHDRLRDHRRLVCRRGADERAASARPLRQRRAERLFDPGPCRRLAQHGAAETSGAAPGRGRTLAPRLRHRADFEAQSRLSRPDHPRGNPDRLLFRRGPRYRTRGSHRLHALARPFADALARRFADCARSSRSRR